MSHTESKEHYNDMYINGVIGEGEGRSLPIIVMISLSMAVQVVFHLITTLLCWRAVEEKVCVCEREREQPFDLRYIYILRSSPFSSKLHSCEAGTR